ncbi:MAG: hypothetical protein IKG69_06865 [Atopobiaceae bacterium]|nr:hypothetical protein [Atopobiaceae bacterium]
MALSGHDAIDELWKLIKGGFARRLGVVTASTTVDVQVKSHGGTVLDSQAIPSASATSAGVLCAADKAKLDGIEAGATVDGKTYTLTKTGSNIVLTDSAGNAWSVPDSDTTDLNTLGVYSKAQVDSAIAAAVVGVATYQSVAHAESDISGTAYKRGQYWVVGTSGTYFGEACEPGDMIFARNNKGATASSADFDIVQTNITEMTRDEVDAICTFG